MLKIVKIRIFQAYYNRIENIIEVRLGEHQFGFRESRGTREAI